MHVRGIDSHLDSVCVTEGITIVTLLSIPEDEDDGFPSKVFIVLATVSRSVALPFMVAKHFPEYLLTQRLPAKSYKYFPCSGPKVHNLNVFCNEFAIVATLWKTRHTFKLLL